MFYTTLSSSFLLIRSGCQIVLGMVILSLTHEEDQLATVKLRLQRGEFQQVSGPVTGRRYVFVRKVGKAPVDDVDEADVPAMLKMKGGCCGVHYPMFRKVEDE